MLRAKARALGLWADRVLGVSSGWGLVIAFLAFAVLMQWVGIAVQVLRKLGMI